LAQRRVRHRLLPPPFSPRLRGLTRPEHESSASFPRFRGVLEEASLRNRTGDRWTSAPIARHRSVVSAAGYRVSVEGSVQPHVTSNRFQPRHRSRPAPATADQPGRLPLAPKRTTFQGALSELRAPDGRSLRHRRMLGLRRPPPNFATFPVAAEVASVLPLGAVADPPPAGVLPPTEHASPGVRCASVATPPRPPRFHRDIVWTLGVELRWIYR
jgi:hypothetical protein